jgi:two-component system response regulator GlrR
MRGFLGGKPGAHGGLFLAEPGTGDNFGFVPRRIKDQHIVIVEDDAFVSDALDSHFKAQNEVRIFSSAEQALAEEEKLGDTNVFIIDFQLPGKNGIELFQYLRLRFARAKYILITGEMSYETADNTRKLGPDALMLKPFDFAILEDNICTLVEQP